MHDKRVKRAEIELSEKKVQWGLSIKVMDEAPRAKHTST